MVGVEESDTGMTDIRTHEHFHAIFLAFVDNTDAVGTVTGAPGECNVEQKVTRRKLYWQRSPKISIKIESHVVLAVRATHIFTRNSERLTGADLSKRASDLPNEKAF